MTFVGCCCDTLFDPGGAEAEVLGKQGRRVLSTVLGSQKLRSNTPMLASNKRNSKPAAIAKRIVKNMTTVKKRRLTSAWSMFQREKMKGCGLRVHIVGRCDASLVCCATHQLPLVVQQLLISFQLAPMGQRPSTCMCVHVLM